MRIRGHGVDIVDIPRVQRMLQEHGRAMLTRVFTAEERRECEKDVRVASRLAARFAAKEAAMKALGTGLADGITWHDVSVANDDAGAPHLVVVGRAAELAAEQGVSSWMVSLSHTGEYAVASVIALG